jgi:hypothetical protein
MATFGISVVTVTKNADGVQTARGGDIVTLFVPVASVYRERTGYGACGGRTGGKNARRGAMVRARFRRGMTMRYAADAAAVCSTR